MTKDTTSLVPVCPVEEITRDAKSRIEAALAAVEVS